MFILENVDEEERIIHGNYRMINLKNVKTKHQEPWLCVVQICTKVSYHTLVKQYLSHDSVVHGSSATIC